MPPRIATRALKFVPRREAASRATRQDGKTLYHQLLNLGHTPEDIVTEAGDQDINLRGIGLVLMHQEGSEAPIVGVGYGGDFRAEEEWGISGISKLLASADTQTRLVETGTLPDGRMWLALTSDRVRGYDRDERLAHNVREADRRSRFTYYDGYWNDESLTVTELRAQLKAAGVSPLPQKKAAALAMFRRIVRVQPEFQPVGEFHDGSWLVMLPCTPVLQDALRLLAKGARTNSLRFGGSTNPFSRAVALFDERDLTAQTVNDQRADEHYHRTQLEAAADAIDALKAEGQLYAIRPGRLAPHRTVNGVRVDLPHGDYFFVNYSRRGSKQMHGWFTLDELRALAAGELVHT